MREEGKLLEHIQAPNTEKDPEVFLLHSLILRRPRTNYHESENVIRLDAWHVQDLILIDLYSGAFFILPYGGDVEEARQADLYKEVDQVIKRIKEAESASAEHVTPVVFVPALNLWETLSTYEFTESMGAFRPTDETRRLSLKYALRSFKEEFDSTDRDP